MVDIGNAFLESKADKEIIMRLLSGFWEVLGQANKDVQVIEALYGLKQAGRLWYQKLVNILIDYGFTRNIYDPCICCLNRDGAVIKVACHVDDFLIISNSKGVRAKFIDHLERLVNKVKLFMEDKTYLGM